MLFSVVSWIVVQFLSGLLEIKTAVVNFRGPHVLRREKFSLLRAPSSVVHAFPAKVPYNDRART